MFDFLSDFLGVFGDLWGVLQTVLTFIVQFVVAVASFIWQGLVFVFNALVGAVKAVGDFFTHLWGNFFKGIFTHLFSAIRTAWTWLESHLRPLLNFLKRLQQQWLRIYRTYIRPVLNMLNHVRQVLSILKALHIKWAAALDGVIARVEGDIQKAFLAVNSVLNASINLLNILADPAMLLRRPTLLLSFRNIFHALIRSVTGLPPAFFFPSPKPGAGKGLGFLPLNFNRSNPDHNPPASYYLGLDFGVPGLQDQDPTIPVADTFADGVGAIDAFDDTVYPPPDCVDLVECLNQTRDLWKAAVKNG